MRPSSLRVACADGRVTRAWTAGDGKPLLLLHGWGLDGRAYRAGLLGLAAAGWRVVAPTANVSVGSWSLPGLAQRVALVADALGLPPCPVVGHSFGGVLAARYALDFPERVTTLVVINAALVSPGKWTLVRLGAPGAHYRLAADWQLARAFARAHHEVRSLPHLAGSVRWMLSTDLAGELPRLRERGVPSAVLWAKDTCLPDAVGTGAAELMGASFERIEPAAGETLDHTWPLRCPERFVERVAGVLGDEARGPRASLPSFRAAQRSFRATHRS